MAESKLRTLSVDFAVQILNLVKALKSQHETIVSNQIGRAGTSIGANIHEAQYAHGKTGFYRQTANCPQRSQRNQLLAGTSLENKLH